MSVKAARLGLGALGVVLALAATAQPSAAEDGAKHDAADAATLAKGRDIFTNYGCGGCHSLAAAGAEGHVGPVLDNPTLTKDVIVDRVVNGSGPMPAFGDQLSKEDLSALAAFILQSQHK